MIFPRIASPGFQIVGEFTADNAGQLKRLADINKRVSINFANFVQSRAD